jgi:general secretion pathway protein M
MTNWWQSRTLREQRLILVMLSLMAIVLVWLAILRPIGDAHSAAKERHGKAVIALAEARARAASIRSLERQRRPALNMPIETLVGQSASEAGFALSQLRGEGGTRVTLAIAAARPQAFFAWVERLEREHGFIVDRLTAGTNSDRSLNVELTLRMRGG